MFGMVRHLRTKRILDKSSSFASSASAAPLDLRVNTESTNTIPSSEVSDGAQEVLSNRAVYENCVSALREVMKETKDTVALLLPMMVEAKDLVEEMKAFARGHDTISESSLSSSPCEESTNGVDQTGLKTGLSFMGSDAF